MPETMVQAEPRLAFFILPSERYNSGEDIFPCIAKEGESGYHRTDWNWGKDVDAAQKLCDKRNERAGLAPADVEAIIDSTMCR